MWLLWTGCWLGHGETTVGVGVVDTPPDTAVETDSPALGDLAITLRFSRYEGEVGCEGSGASQIELAFGDSTITLPCDDVLTWRGVPAEEAELSVRAEIMEDGPFYAGSQVVSVEADAVTDVEMTLPCDENGWDDGCGGA